MRILPYLTRPAPPTTLACIAALGIARSGGLKMLFVRIGIAAVMATGVVAQ